MSDLRNYGVLSCSTGEVSTYPPQTDYQAKEHYNGWRATLTRWDGSEWVIANEASPQASGPWATKSDLNDDWYLEDGQVVGYIYWRVQPGYLYAVSNEVYDYGDGHSQYGWSRINRVDDYTMYCQAGPAQDAATQPPPPDEPPPPTDEPVPPCGTEGDAGYLYPAKMRVERARVLREERRLDVLAPITARARGGEVKVTYQADRRTDTFDAEVTEGDATLDRIRFKEPITRGQARLGTGIVAIDYKGDADTRPEEVRLRAASQRAELDVEEISLIGDRLSAQGSVTGRAEGIVRFQYSYLDAAGNPQVYPARATIQADGDWELDEDVVPPQVARCGGYLSILFTGYFERRIRGEMLAYQLNPGETRNP